MNLDNIVAFLDAGRNVAPAARQARIAAEECERRRAGMAAAHPARVAAGKMDGGDAAARLWAMGNAIIVCQSVAEELERLAAERAAGERGLFPPAGAAE